MTGKTNAGSGGGTILGVEYPVGAVCTAAQGSITLRAKDTSGYMIFFLPSGGEWVVYAVNGGSTYTKTVQIQQGRVHVLSLNGLEYFFSNGDSKVELEGTYTIEGGEIRVNSSNGSTGARFTIPEIQAYNKIHITQGSAVASRYLSEAEIRVVRISTSETVASVAFSRNAAGTTKTIDLAGLGLEGNGYRMDVYVYSTYVESGWIERAINISKIWGTSE